MSAFTDFKKAVIFNQHLFKYCVIFHITFNKFYQCVINPICLFDFKQQNTNSISIYKLKNNYLKKFINAKFKVNINLISLFEVNV